MKKLNLKSKILLGAILMGGTVAGAHAFVNLPSADDPTYNWVSEPNAPQNPSQILLDKTEEVAADHFGCEGDTHLCATGTPIAGGDNAILRFD